MSTVRLRRAAAPGADGDTRFTWGLILAVFDALEQHGYHRDDDEHVGRAIGMIRDAARVYEGGGSVLPGDPGVMQPGGGWISGASQS